MEPIHQEFPFSTELSFKPLLDHLNAARTSPCATTLHFPGKALPESLELVPELYEPVQDSALLKRHGDLLKQLMATLFSPLFWDTDIVGAVRPFSMNPVFVSPGFHRLFLEKNGSFGKPMGEGDAAFTRGSIIHAYLCVLERFYGIQRHLDYPLIRIVEDPETGLTRYFKMKLDFRFVDVLAQGEPKSLSDEERALVLNHMAEPEILQEILPPEQFLLRGFTILRAVDVTDSEVLSGLERDLIDQESIVSRSGFLRLQERLRTLFRHPELVASLAGLQDDQVHLLNSGCQKSGACLFSDTSRILASELKGTMFEQAVRKDEIFQVPDITASPHNTLANRRIIQCGVRSLIIAPLRYKGRCIGTLDLGSPQPGDFGPMDVLHIRQIRPLFSMALKHAMDDLESRIQGVIKEKCTAVHPTVEWRFRKAAVNHIESLRAESASEIEPIVFKNVYPFYGASDIRGSTGVRNRAIQGDLSEHLSLGLNVIRSAHDARSLPVLEELAGRMETHHERIRSGLATGDELSVARFLKEEVESLFAHLTGFGPKVAAAVEAYESAMDSEKGTVYRLRKEFEESVSLLNDRIAAYLDQEEAAMQAIFPHYFEKHRTDGMDYLIYAGASLTEDGEFHELYVKNLQLWQLKVACGIARQAEQMKGTLKIPLEMVHLILVQDTPLSIRFRYDEKRFDVDGTYDIRHEIIKSRIDKALVRGATERLTQPGKIAIVYSHAEEARETHRHIRYLQSEGFLDEEVETLDLEELASVQGLKALRVGINLDSQAISHGHGQTASELFAA